MAIDGPRATALALGAVLLVCLAAFRSIGLTLSALASLAAGVCSCWEPSAGVARA